MNVKTESFIPSRPIKFRVWNGEEMISPDYIDRQGVAHWRENSIPTGGRGLMQFTGLKASDDKTEIYEGDIVRDRYGRIMEVGYWDFKLCWIAITETNFHHADFHDWADRGGKRDDVVHVEVIGNIYQNPELINKPAQ